MAADSERQLGAYQKWVTYALGEGDLEGPSDEMVASFIEAADQLGTRAVGWVMARRGFGQEVLLGMLDEDRFTLDDTIDALVMHEEPEVIPPDLDNGKNDCLVFAHSDTGPWELVPGALVITGPSED